MLSELAKSRIEKFVAVVSQFNGLPEGMFVKAIIGGIERMMLSAVGDPTAEQIYQFQDCLDNLKKDLGIKHLKIKDSPDFNAYIMQRLDANTDEDLVKVLTKMVLSGDHFGKLIEMAVNSAALERASKPQ